MTGHLRERLRESGALDEFSDRELRALGVLLLSDVAASLREIGGLLAESASGSGAVQFSVFDHNGVDVRALSSGARRTSAQRAQCAVRRVRQRRAWVCGAAGGG